MPHAVCSLTNVQSSSCSACNSGISLPGSATGAPGLSSIAWSHRHDSGNSCEASSENTLEYAWYCEGMLGFSDVCLGSATILQMYILLACDVLGLLICHGRNCAHAASGL